jgi:fatty acyl-CoA reductase
MNTASENSGERGRIAAVFDIDGTLLPASSLEWRLLAHLISHRELRFGAVFQWLRNMVMQCLWKRQVNLEDAKCAPLFDENKSYLRGVRIAAVEEWKERRFSALEFYPEALAMVDWHRRRGHRIVFISGTLAPLAREVGAMLSERGEIFVRATEIECEDNRWTGRVCGEAVCGAAKERALLRLAEEHHFDLSRSYAYADSMKDRWLLGAVGHSTVVNPSAILARNARRYGWRIVNWYQRARLVERGERVQRSLMEHASWK